MLTAVSTTAQADDKKPSRIPYFKEVPFPISDADKRNILASDEVTVDGKIHKIGFNTIFRSGEVKGQETFGLLLDQKGQPVKNTDGSVHVSVEVTVSETGAKRKQQNSLPWAVSPSSLPKLCRYQSIIEGARMIFPDRLTLPTRPIIPTTNNPSCTICHRLVNDHTEPTKPSLEDLDDRRQLTTLGNNHTGRFSPDGRSIAFVSDRSGSDQIWLMDKDGRNQHQLTSGPMEHSWPNLATRQPATGLYRPQSGQMRIYSEKPQRR